MFSASFPGPFLEEGREDPGNEVEILSVTRRKDNSGPTGIQSALNIKRVL